MQYFHVRRYDYAGLLQAKGGCTFAMIEEKESIRLRWGVCKCHEQKDQFCKATGRIKSGGRAVSETQSFFTIELSDSEQVFFVQNLAYFMSIHKTLIPTMEEIKSAIVIAKSGLVASSTFRILTKKPKKPDIV